MMSRYPASIALAMTPVKLAVFPLWTYPTTIPFAW